ncbi:lipoprotein-releasing ABC transporter permease subunit LolE [Catenovulum sp. SM1970]|uniref:lipoprotein-releasing ABC transporter permease subunit LolE n=1 Tax=Marinifaba aquimaris TaxID=2741323 RepID=UPI001573C7CD|nr:lipoprotein-releasing ABC transporter permease subunit LolE [Marinifaba aquimaris]NTS77654.1 lipoprotein-releasing ABC transporter permease subunit LolE [Marinifaba aquimaris]
MGRLLYSFLGLAGLVGWRYARSSSKNRFIRFISASSIIGIALGCGVLILVLSAMNGFEHELKNRLLSVVPHVEYTAVENEGLQNWQAVAKQVKTHPSVEAIAPFVKFNGMLQQGEKIKPVAVSGIDWQFEKEVSDLANYLAVNELNQFVDHGGMLLGAGLAESLNVKVGDSIELLVPKISATGKLAAPKVIRLSVAGIFKLGGQLDYLQAYIPLNKAKEIGGWQQGVQGLRLKVNQVFDAPYVARQVGYDLPYYVYISDWTREYGHLYNDIQLVRTVMYLILTLVIAVACFNIVSTLVMAVNERAGDIAILRTMGATQASIIKSFTLQGLYNGLIGVFWGTSLGVLATLYLSDLIGALESALGMQFLSGDVYFIDFLPTQLQVQDVILTVVVAIIMSTLATLYPAFRASRLQPAQVL